MAAKPRRSKWNFHAGFPSPCFPGMKVNHYLVQSGLFAGEYPGHQDPEVARVRLGQLVEKGVRTFIDLTSDQDREDGLSPYDPHFASVDGGRSLGLRRHSFQIPDMGIPSDPGVMRGALDRIRGEIAAGRPCYVHCWGGIGRTGTAVGCWLRDSGLDGEAALERVQGLYGSHMDADKLSRYPRSPQQPVQLRYVMDWPSLP